MAGEAKTTDFIIGEATVMIGPVADLMSLNKDAHSIGLVKNFSLTSTPAFQELTQGTQNALVFSIATENDLNASMEAYEFTGQNLAYGLSLSGTHVKNTVEDVLDGGLAAADTTLDIDSLSDNSSDYPVGAWITIQPATGDRDDVHVTKVASVNYVSTTLTVTFEDAIPTGKSFADGDKVIVCSNFDVKDAPDNNFYAAKVVGIMPADNKPITILFPKIRITQGFNLAFGSQDYSNLPFEFKPYSLVAADPLYADFKGNRAVLVRQ